MDDLTSREARFATCKVDGIHLYPGNEETGHKPCISLIWSGCIGFGEYQLVLNGNYDDYRDNEDYQLGIKGYNECMDKGEERDFLKQLLLSLLEKVEVVE